MNVNVGGERGQTQITEPVIIEPVIIQSDNW